MCACLEEQDQTDAHGRAPAWSSSKARAERESSDCQLRSSNHCTSQIFPKRDPERASPGKGASSTWFPGCGYKCHLLLPAQSSSEEMAAPVPGDWARVCQPFPFPSWITSLRFLEALSQGGRLCAAGELRLWACCFCRRGGEPGLRDVVVPPSLSVCLGVAGCGRRGQARSGSDLNQQPGWRATAVACGCYLVSNSSSLHPFLCLPGPLWPFRLNSCAPSQVGKAVGAMPGSWGQHCPCMGLL